VRDRDSVTGTGVRPHGARGTGPTLAFAGAWLLAALLVGVSGGLATLNPPAPQLLLAALTIAFVLTARYWPALRQFMDTVDLRILVLVHVTRFVGFYFLALHARGELPWAFAVPGGWGDITVAAAAVVLVLGVRWERPGGRRLYVAWNVAGLVDILGVVLTAARLALAEPASMGALLRLPLSLLLTFVVPIVIGTHVLMLARLLRGRPAG
jgi:hypothetical protein